MGIFKQALGLIKINMKQSLTWRFDFITRFILSPVTLFVYYFLWKSIYTYSNQTIIRGYTFGMLIGYYVLSMITNSLVWTSVDENMSHQIRRGKMTQKLLRPMAYLPHNVLGSLGIKLTETIFYSLPLLAFGMIFFGVKLSINALFFIPVMAMAYMLNFMIAFITGMSAFWLTKNTGLISIRRTVIGFVSGAFIPLSFLPLALQKVSSYLPFQYIQFVPINVFLGAYKASQIPMIILIQSAWIAVLYLMYKAIWKAGVNKYTGVGQ